MALLKSKIGSSFPSRCWGIFLMSVSSPTQRKVFFVKICSMSCCRVIVIAFYSDKLTSRQVNKEISFESGCTIVAMSLSACILFACQLGLQFRFFHSFSVLGNSQCVNHVLDVAAEKALQVVCGVADAVVGHAALLEVVRAYFRAAVAC